MDAATLSHEVVYIAAALYRLGRLSIDDALRQGLGIFVNVVLQGVFLNHLWVETLDALSPHNGLQRRRAPCPT